MVRLSNTPWTRPSNGDQRLHAILHVVKAAGRLASILVSEGHGGRPGEPTAVDQPRYAADLVISAIRLADVCGFDLEAAVLARQRQRNEVREGEQSMSDEFHRKELASAYGLAGAWLDDCETQTERQRQTLQMAQLALTLLIRSAEATKRAIGQRLGEP